MIMFHVNLQGVRQGNIGDHFCIVQIRGPLIKVQDDSFVIRTVDGSEIPFPTTVWMVLKPYK